MTHAPVVHSLTKVFVEPGLPYPGPAPLCSEPPRSGGRREQGRPRRRAGSLGAEIGDGKEADEKDTDEGYGGAAELLVEGLGSGFRLRRRRGHEMKGPFGGLKETRPSVFSALSRSDPTRSLFSLTLSWLTLASLALLSPAVLLISSLQAFSKAPLPTRIAVSRIRS